MQLQSINELFGPSGYGDFCHENFASCIYTLFGVTFLSAVGPYFTKSWVPIGSLLLSSDVPISFGIIGLHNFVARLVLAQTFIILLRFLSKKLAGETSGTRSQDLEINILSTQAAFCPDEQDQ